MSRHMKPYDLHITLSEGKHNTQAIDAKLTDAKGKRMFGLRDAGPLTDVHLPTGHYRVVADFGGVKRGGSGDVKQGESAQLHLHWPKDAA